MILALPAYAGLSVPITYDAIGELDPNQISVQADAAVGALFPLGRDRSDQCGCVSAGHEFRRKSGGGGRSRFLTKELGSFTYVDGNGVEKHPVLSVRSLTNPLGDTSGAFFTRLPPAGRRKMAAVNHTASQGDVPLGHARLCGRSDPTGSDLPVRSVLGR